MDKEGFQRFLGEINDLLHDFGMTIQRGREETKNGKGFLVLVRATRLMAAVGLTIGQYGGGQDLGERFGLYACAVGLLQRDREWPQWPELFHGRSGLGVCL
jgi:hypothetical protein